MSWYSYNQRGILWGQNAEDSPPQGTDWGRGCCPTLGWSHAAGKNNWENRLESLCLPWARDAHCREGPIFASRNRGDMEWAQERKAPCPSQTPLTYTGSCSSQAVWNHLGGCSVSAWLHFKALLQLFSQSSSDLERSSQMCWQLWSWHISIQGTKP